MKKLISVFLILVLCLAPVSVFAEASGLEETLIMMGDMNNDNKISATDARTALRYAAKLEPADSIEPLRYDADGDGKLSSADARIILRVAAKISQFTYGFDGNGTPCVVKTLQSGTYYIEIKNYDEITDLNMVFSIARNGNNVYMMSDDMSVLDSDNEMKEMIEAFGIKKYGIILDNGEFYMPMTTDYGNLALHITKESQESLDMTPDSFLEITDMINSLIPDSLSTPTRTTLNGEEVFCYTYTTMNQESCIYIGTNGRLIQIDDNKADNNSGSIITFNNISGDKPDKYFDLSGYEIQEI